MLDKDAARNRTLLAKRHPDAHCVEIVPADRKDDTWRDLERFGEELVPTCVDQPLAVAVLEFDPEFCVRLTGLETTADVLDIVDRPTP